MRTTALLILLFYILASGLPAFVSGEPALAAAAAGNAGGSETASDTGAPQGMPYQSLDSLFSLYQPSLANISAYKPMYFLVGTDPKYSKFQISFKYCPLSPHGPLAEKYPWARGFHFAYTQTSFWDLRSASVPFEDTSYKPEFLFLTNNILAEGPDIKRLFLRTGFQHESNGRAAESSRSTNFLYISPIFVIYDAGSQIGFQIAPRLWTYVANDNSTNADLRDYRGYFDLELKVGKADGLVMDTLLWWAKEGGSVELNLTFPLSSFTRSFEVYLQAQYVNALAESLLNYRDRTEAFRLGFAIVR